MLDVNLVNILEFDYAATAAGQAVIYSDLPGDIQTARETLAMPSTTGRRVVRLKLHGTTKGRSFKFEVTSGSGVLRLYGGRIYAKELGPGGKWRWINLPVPPTSEEWAEHALPIEPTSDAWGTYRLPIETTPDERVWVEIPVAA